MAEKTIAIADSITVGELAEALDLQVSTLVGELFKNGIVATINQKIDFETATIIIEELGIDVDLVKKETSLNSEKKVHELSAEAVERPPIVAVMGHVDHGKTSLLDAILDKKVVDSEAGGITQHISAYQTTYNKRKITLLDTPGHEAFAALRQHGAALTDVVIIVVAADDGVKPQTVEAIKFARSANAKIVVAINKIDKQGADPARVKAQLASEHSLNPEEWGGETVMVEVSAKTKQGIDKLLEMVLLVADIEELKADVNVPAEGLVIEAHMETGKGSVVGLLVEHGVLKPSSLIVAGMTYGKIRTLLNFNHEAIKEAGPSTPVVVTGFKELPQFGDRFFVVKSEKEARSFIEIAKIDNEKNIASTNVTSADLIKLMDKKRDTQEFNIVVKADVQGSLTSVIDSLKLIDTKGEIIVRVIGSGVGNITENDIRLVSADQNAIIYGFNVDLPPAIKKIALREKVEVRLYKVIYELLDDAKSTMESMLAPEIKETQIGTLQIKGVFRSLRDEIIAGGLMTSGKLIPGLNVRIYRKTEGLDNLIGEAEVVSVQKQKIQTKEVIEGDMCGFQLKTIKKLLIQEGDSLEFFSREIINRKL